MDKILNGTVSLLPKRLIIEEIQIHNLPKTQTDKFDKIQIAIYNDKRFEEVKSEKFVKDRMPGESFSISYEGENMELKGDICICINQL